MLEAPAHFVAGQRAVAELLLRDADRLDVEDAVDDAEIVVDAADALLVLEVALAGAVDRLDDLLQHRIFGARGLGGDGDVALGGVAGRDDVLFGVGPDVADDVVGREAGLLRRLERHRVHHAPAAQDDIVRLGAADRQPLRLLLVAGMRHLDLLHGRSRYFFASRS